MLAHGDKNAFEAVLRAGSNARSRCSEQQMEQLRTVRLWAKTNLKVRTFKAAKKFVGSANVFVASLQIVL